MSAGYLTKPGSLGDLGFLFVKTALTENPGAAETASILQRRLTYHLFKAGNEIGHLANPTARAMASTCSSLYRNRSQLLFIRRVSRYSWRVPQVCWRGGFLYSLSCISAWRLTGNEAARQSTLLGTDAVRDSSAAAIAVCGLLELVKALPTLDANRGYYEEMALRIALPLTDNYLADDDDPTEGLLQHSVYHMGCGKGVDQCCCWGRLFLS